MRRRQWPLEDQGTVELAPALSLWRAVQFEVRDYHGLDLDLVVSWSEELRQLVVSRLAEVQPTGVGKPLTGEALRKIALHQFIRHAVLESVRSGLTPGGGRDQQDRLAYGVITKEQAEKCKAAGPVPETLEWVATLYRIMLATGDTPTKNIRDVFGVSQSTAGAWVAAARRAGLLGEAEGQGKAGG